MINRFKPIPALCLLLFAGQAAWAQSPGGWSLRKCIDYARENNIQVHSTQVTQQSSQEDLAEAKAKTGAFAGFLDVAELRQSEKRKDGREFRS